MFPQVYNLQWALSVIMGPHLIREGQIRSICLSLPHRDLLLGPEGMLAGVKPSSKLPEMRLGRLPLSPQLCSLSMTPVTCASHPGVPHGTMWRSREKGGEEQQGGRW